MIGFFEHQYLSYKKNHIRNLLTLAKVDGHMHEKEENMLYKIGKRYGLKDRQIKELIDGTDPHEFIIPDNHNDKMNLLYDLLMMIHADGVVDKHEITFFEDAVEKFGMRKEMVTWLLSIFDENDRPPADEWEEIKQEALEKYTI